MFTGLVAEMGSVIKIQHGTNSAVLTIGCNLVLEKLKLGDSIAVNGICLTVVRFDSSTFAADVMAETLKKTNLGSLRAGEKVNLEPALSLGERLGGHLVSGHIDAVGVISSIDEDDIAMLITVTAPDELLHYVIKKGSIAIDGISLTVVEAYRDSFTVSLIPHTAKMATLGYKRVGAKVNLEADMIGKYVAKYVSQLSLGEAKQPKGKIDSKFLAENGFI